MPRPERPLDAAHDAVQRFAADLRELRRRAGGLTYRQLAERSGYAVSTVSEAAGGRRLPTLDVALAYAMACGGDEQEWSAKWHTAALAVAEMRDTRCLNGDGRGPYRGLASFREEDAGLFFGREELVADVVERVSAHPVTVLVGASGVGRSSLIEAGVVPAWRARGPEFRAVVMTPGDGGLDALPADGSLLIVVDRFEDLFTRHDAAGRACFLDRLLGLTGRARLVLSLRAGFRDRCAEHAALHEVVRDNEVLVGPMGREELCAAVSKPALTVGASVERALLVTVLNEAQGQAGALPLLSHALLETWRRRRGDVLTVAGFTAAGGIGAAVAQTAEAVFCELDPAWQSLATDLLLRMVAVDEDTTAAGRRRVDLAELRGVAQDADLVLNRLADARLVTVGGGTAEIAHDAVLTAWPRLRGWIDEHREALRVHQAITAAARTWLDDFDPAALATGPRLELMRSYARSTVAPVRLSRAEREFVEESAAQVRRVEAVARVRTRRLRVVTAAAVVCALVAGLLAIVASNARIAALHARDNALSRQTALTARNLRDPGLAAQLAIAGHRIAPTTESRSALLESSSAPLPARYLGGAGPTALAASADGALVAVSNATDGSVQLFTEAHGQLIRAASIKPRQTAGVMVYALALSPDGDTLAIGDREAAITLWNVSDPRSPRPLAAPLDAAGGPVERLAFDASGTQLASAGGDRILRWAVSDPANPLPLAPLPAAAPTKTVTFGSGGLLAFGTATGQVHLWNAGTNTELAVLEAGNRVVPAVSISPDGRTLVAGSHDRTLRSWDISAPSSPKPAKAPVELFNFKVTTTAFSPDGRHLLAGSADSTMRVLDTAAWTTVQTLAHPDVVSWATFTDDGRSIASVAADGALRVWKMSTALPRLADAPVTDTPFSDDGTRLAVFTEDGAALWDTSDPTDTKPRGTALTGTAFSGSGDLSGDGNLLAAGTTAGEVHLMDVTDPARPHLRARLGGSQGEVMAVAFSPDGRLLAAAGRDTSIRIWDLITAHPQLVTVLDAPRDLVLDLNWHHSGRILAAASGDSDVYLFEVTGTPRLLSRLEGLDSLAFSATFSPSGNVLAAGGVDCVVLLWDVTDPAAPRRIGDRVTGPTGRILELSFHPAGDQLAAAAIDGSAWLWNVTDPASPTRTAVLSSGVSPLNTAVFRPVGDLLVTGGSDRRLHTWRTDEAAVISAICAGVGDPLTEGEWTTYLPEVPYAPPCRRS